MNQTYTHIYFIGIGGIGMSALARYYKQSGAEVAGYDLTESDLCKELVSEGIHIHYRDDVSAIPTSFTHDAEKTLVIMTPAVPEEHSELQYFIQKGFRVVKRARALGVVAEDKRVLAISGTHGKTTTSTLLAHILTDSGMGCSAFLGGISKNYNTNLLVSENALLVAEADEFDRSFLQLFPQIAVITSMDADHLDIYGSHEALTDSFCDFASQIKDGGMLILKQGLLLPEERLKDISALIFRYALEEKADFYASNLLINKNGCYTFDLHLCDKLIHDCTLGVPGWVNVENAIAASACAYLSGCDETAIRNALARFKGVKRRFDIHLMTDEHIIIDDYAHHPNELSASISAIKKVYPDRKLTGIFQPHLYSRTNDFHSAFAESLSLLDECILLPIYPARELPMPGVDSGLIYRQVTCIKHLFSKAECLEWISKEKPELIACFGAGDIELMVDKIVQAVK